MKTKVNLSLGFILFFVLISACPLFSQDQAATEQPAAQQAPLSKSIDQEVLSSEPEMQWIWGDVVSVDPVAKKIQVKYLDYETDTEKEISIEADAKTTYENAGSLEEIKPLDTLSIDYMMNAEGKNMAKNISVEKPESAQAMPQEAPLEVPKEEPKATTPAAQ